LFSRPASSDLAPQLEVGAIAGSPSTEPKVESTPNDIRDKFFKSGMSEQFKDQLIPGAETAAGGALTLDLFTPEFFQDINNIAPVFSETGLEQGAVDKFKNQFRSKYSGSDYNQDEVNQILSLIPKSLPVDQTIKLPEPQKRRKTLDEYLSSGRTAAQWYAETGQQSSLDAIRSDPRASFDDKSGAISYVGGGGSSGGYAGGSSPQTRAYQSNRAAGGISYGPGQNYTPSFANFTSADTGQPAYHPPPQISQPAQSQGIFQRIKNWFQRR